MLGCDSAATERASRSKRDSASASAARCGGRILIATSRPSRVSLARHTSPMPPAPSGARISKGPRRSPARNAERSRMLVAAMIAERASGAPRRAVERLEAQQDEVGLVLGVGRPPDELGLLVAVDVEQLPARRGEARRF